MTWFLSALVTVIGRLRTLPSTQRWHLLCRIVLVDSVDIPIVCLIGRLLWLKIWMFLCWTLIRLFLLRRMKWCACWTSVRVLDVRKAFLLLRLISSGDLSCVLMTCLGLVVEMMVTVQVFLSWRTVCCMVLSRLVLRSTRRLMRRVTILALALDVNLQLRWLSLVWSLVRPLTTLPRIMVSCLCEVTGRVPCLSGMLRAV